MNGKERIEKVLQGQWPDQRPVMIHNFMMAVHEAGMTMDQYHSYSQNIAQAHIQAAELFGDKNIQEKIKPVILQIVKGIVVTSLKPLADNKCFIVRLFNAMLTILIPQ